MSADFRQHWSNQSIVCSNHAMQHSPVFLFGKTLEKGGDKEGKQGKIWDNLGGNVTHLSTSEDNVSLQHHPYPLRQE